jgi:uncharacterized repeat protein (TIGR03803 family)
MPVAEAVNELTVGFRNYSRNVHIDWEYSATLLVILIDANRTKGAPEADFGASGLTSPRNRRRKRHFLRGSQVKLARTANIRQIRNSGEPRAASVPAYALVHRVRTIACTAAIAAALLLTLASQARAAAAVSVLHTFSGGNDGSYPDSNLTVDSAGNFYGTTQIGGAFGSGTVFEISPKPDGKWRFSVLYTFTGGADGGNPLGSLVFDAAGNAYTTASSGGANGFGVVFELSPPVHPAPGKEWAEKVLYSFRGGSDGALPFGNLVFDAAGNLYGTTSIGGKSHIGCLAGCGTIYELSLTKSGSWNETVLHRLTDAFGDGAEPRAGLVMDASGNLFGTTYEGGNNDVCNGYGCGSVFELTPPASGKKRWHFKTLIDFNGIEGALSGGGVILDGSGNVFGTTLFGGANNAGVVFSLSRESGRWKFKTLYSFDGLDGLQPSGNLAFDNAGNLYGATYEGGANDWGGIFQLVPGGSGWTENLLYSFLVSGKRFGASPLGGAILDATGDLYLTTNQGGNLNDCQPNAGCGTVIKLSSETP